MSATVTIDSVGFRAMLDSLARISGKTYEEVLKQQTAAVLQRAMDWTPKADRKAIIKSMSQGGNQVEFSDGTEIATWWNQRGEPDMFLDDSTFEGTKNRPNLYGGKSWHQMNNGRRRWSNERWAKYQQKLSEAAQVWREKQAKKLRAIGITKKSWVKCAEDLGIPLKTPGYVTKSIASNGKTYKDGKGARVDSGSTFYFEITNTNPALTGGKLDGQGILSRAIQARIKAFQNDLKVGVFNDLKNRAARYPGIFVKP